MRRKVGPAPDTCMTAYDPYEVEMTRRAIIFVQTVFLLCIAATAWAQAAPEDEQAPAGIGRYTPTQGFKVADTEYGDLNVRLFMYVRYLSQRLVDESYTDAFGNTRAISQRQDMQVNKAQVYFFGWLMDPKFRYLAYVWTTNVSQGLSTQVLLAGNLTYAFNEHITLGAGISGLPGTRSVSGSFPYWLAVDTRLVSDEFFRPSYTTGLFASGRIAGPVFYEVMLGNNMSQLGIDAGQLDNSFTTLSAALTWMPTTGEFGRQRGFGDFDRHEDVATLFGLHFTRSDEDRQSQPDTDAFDNVQIRLSDGSVIFQTDLFGPGMVIEEATYHMVAADAGVKYRGLSLEGEYYWRWVNNFKGQIDGLPFDELNDHGFQLQASAMVRPQSVQAYLGGSKVNGEYGNPWDIRGGVNWFPWKNQVVRWNFELIQIDRSPVGALSLPYSVGNNGPIFHSNLMVWF